MATRNSNYAAFYVAEPFDASRLGAHATKDFLYYNLLRTWKGKDPSFPFQDAHATTYNVRDDSDWEKTLKPRLQERIRNSKNIIIFLSSSTSNSKALREEVEYAINNQKLPVIAIYPEFEKKSDLMDGDGFSRKIINIWDKLPIFRDSVNNVPNIHLPMDKTLITDALKLHQYARNS